MATPNEAVEAFTAAEGRKPNQAEEQALRQFAVAHPEMDALEIAESIDLDADLDLRTNSVVNVKYKLRYKDRAKTAKKPAGVSKKAMARSCQDWLAIELMKRTLTDDPKKPKLILQAFVDILDANGVDWSRWTNRSAGWEGRFRMTGRLALQRVVAENEALALPDGTTLTPPKAWVERIIR
jgi:hypothetical protein